MSMLNTMLNSDLRQAASIRHSFLPVDTGVVADNSAGTWQSPGRTSARSRLMASTMPGGDGGSFSDPQQQNILRASAMSRAQDYLQRNLSSTVPAPARAYNSRMADLQLAPFYSSGTAPILGASPIRGAAVGGTVSGGANNRFSRLIAQTPATAGPGLTPEQIEAKYNAWQSSLTPEQVQQFQPSAPVKSSVYAELSPQQLQRYQQNGHPGEMGRKLASDNYAVGELNPDDQDVAGDMAKQSMRQHFMNNVLPNDSDYMAANKPTPAQNVYTGAPPAQPKSAWGPFLTGLANGVTKFGTALVNNSGRQAVAQANNTAREDVANINAGARDRATQATADYRKNLLQFNQDKLAASKKPGGLSPAESAHFQMQALDLLSKDPTLSDDQKTLVQQIARGNMGGLSGSAPAAAAPATRPAAVPATQPAQAAPAVPTSDAGWQQNPAGLFVHPAYPGATYQNTERGFARVA